MRIAYLDCFSGISGDMFLGALLDAGVPADVLEKAVSALGIGAELRVSKVDRCGITATKVDVLVAGEVDAPRELVGIVSGRSSEVLDEHGHGHSRAHAQPHGEPWPLARTGVSGPYEHGHSREHGVHSHGRHLSEIKRIIAGAAIGETAQQKGIEIFEALGVAEAKIHNVDIESVHFHEVGAVDALVDIVGAAVGAEALRVDEIVCSPLNVGGGTVECAHGVFPVPAPATVELLRGAPVFSSGVQAELVTPTGAAIAKTLAARFAAFPPMRVERAGYGAGSRNFAGHANVLRLTIGETVEVGAVLGTAVAPSASADIAPGGAANRTAGTVDAGDGASPVSTSGRIGEETGVTQDTVTVLGANLDDLNPQVFGYVMDRLLAEGALDVFGMAVQMKKNRPGMLLTVLAKPGDAEKLAQIVFAETSTLGVRRRDERRQVLERQWETVRTPWGDVRMKIASLKGAVTNYAPEYEDCRRIAEEKQVPLKSVMQEATRAYLARNP